MINSFCERYSFPEEAKKAFSDAYEKLLSSPREREKIYSAIDEYVLGDGNNYEREIGLAAEKIGVNRYTLNMVLFIMAEQSIKCIYNAKGFSDIYFDTLRDVFYKCEECKKIHGVWGTSVLFWFRCYAKCCLFGLGRLQFEPGRADKDYPGYIKKDEPWVNIHIPSGAPLKLSEVYKSLDKAYEFFGGKGEEMIFTCNTWLLYPPQCDMYAEGSNLKKFAELFDIAEYHDSDRDLWRVFFKEDCSDISSLRAETSLAKKILNRLSEGKSMGYARGFIKYSPVK